MKFSSSIMFKIFNWILAIIALLSFIVWIVSVSLLTHYNFDTKGFSHDVKMINQTLRPIDKKRISIKQLCYYLDSVQNQNAIADSDVNAIKLFEDINPFNQQIDSSNHINVELIARADSIIFISSLFVKKKYVTKEDAYDDIAFLLSKNPSNGFGFLISSRIVYFENAWDYSDIAGALAAICSLLFLTLVAIQISLEAVVANRKDKYELERDVDEAKREAINKPLEIRPAWEEAQLTLQKYYTRNLEQIRWIFWVSVAVMSIGFLLITWGIFLAISKSNNTIIVVTTSSGIITEFIGATFIFIYNSTIKQAISYTDALEKINSVGMSIRILDTLKADDNGNSEKLIDAKIEIAKLLINQSQSISKIV